MPATKKASVKKGTPTDMAAKSKKSTTGHKRLLGADIASGSEKTDLKKATKGPLAGADDIRRKESPQRRISGSGR